MAVKRRTLWFNDDDWSKMQTAAEARNLNVSRLIRELVLRDPGSKPAPSERDIAPRSAPKPRSSASPVQPAPKAEPATTPKAGPLTPAQQQADRDAILHRLSHPG